MFRKGSSTLDAIAPASARSSTMCGLSRKAAETVFHLTGVIQDLVLDISDSYRPERPYMRGPSAKWRAVRDR